MTDQYAKFFAVEQVLFVKIIMGAEIPTQIPGLDRSSGTRFGNSETVAFDELCIKKSAVELLV